MSLVAPPSLSNSAPRYKNSSTSSTCSTFTFILWLSLAFVRITFDFLALILSPTLAASSTSLLVLSSMSTYLDDNKAMSSAKSRSSKTEVSFHRMPVLIPSVCSWPNQLIARKENLTWCTFVLLQTGLETILLFHLLPRLRIQSCCTLLLSDWWALLGFHILTWCSINFRDV